MMSTIQTSKSARKGNESPSAYNSLPRKTKQREASLVSDQKKQNRTIQHTTNLSLTQCKQAGCKRPFYKLGLCKHHFSNNVKGKIRKELRNIYRSPEAAYAAMDFTGRGFVSEEDFLTSMIMKRIPYSQEDVKEYFRQANLFTVTASRGNDDISSSGGINFDLFKKTFFPQLYLIQDEDESEEDREHKSKQRDLKKNREKQPDIIKDRLAKLERLLKLKFQNNWVSVRKAFLDLDTDYDGYITVEDILRYFGQEKELNYNDLKKIIADKDSKKTGKIGYTDFSKWVGNSIHQSEGFYFRHDSIKNPQFDANQEKNEDSKMVETKKIAQDQLINSNLERTVFDKIQFQWKTIRKAFCDLNKEKSGCIMPEELRFYFQHWGLTLTEEQFQYLFKKFDVDRDGKISYKDFQISIGSEIHPAEGLYFRQDKPQMLKINSCKHDKCWQPTAGHKCYCALHSKVHQDYSIQVFGKMFRTIGSKWRRFLTELRNNADPDDTNQVFYDTLLRLMGKYGVNLNPTEKENLQDAFPGRDEGTRRRVNVARLYEAKYNQVMKQMYTQVDVHENDGEDDPVDASGYIGRFFRKYKEMHPITEEDMIKVIGKNNKMTELMRRIREIDREHNGFVTSTELDDLLKIHYKQELGNKDLKPILKKYASIQNRILIDYKGFRDSVVEQLKKLNANFNASGLFSENNSPPQKVHSHTQTPSNERQKKVERSLPKAKSNILLDTSLVRNGSLEKTPIKAHNFADILNRNSLGSDTLNQLKYLPRPKTRQLINTKHSKMALKALNNTIDVSKPFDTREFLLQITGGQGDQKSDSRNFETPKKQSQTRGLGSVFAGGAATQARQSLQHNEYMDIQERDPKGDLNVSLLQHLRERNKTAQGSRMTKGRSVDQSRFNLRLDQEAKNHQTINNQRTQGKDVDFKNAYLNIFQPQSVNAGQLMQGLYTSVSNDNGGNQSASLLTKQRTLLKNKLSYEWRNIYRLLTVNDKGGSGMITQEAFDRILNQSSAFISREDLKRIHTWFGANYSVNYIKMSSDLGLHSTQLDFFKTAKSRVQNVQRLRNLYSSCDKQKPFKLSNPGSGMSRTIDLSNQDFMQTSIGTAKGIDKETSVEIVKDILIKRVKDYRDLVRMYQKKHMLDVAIIPLGEFRTVLKGLGINVGDQKLQKFMVSMPQNENQREISTPVIMRRGERAKSSLGFTTNGGQGANLMAKGVDAREFLKHYI